MTKEKAITKEFIKNLKRSKEPGSYVVTKDGNIVKNLDDEAMKKREKEKKNKDAMLKPVEVSTETKNKIETDNKAEE